MSVEQLKTLSRQVDQAMIKDRHRLKQAIGRTKSLLKQGKPTDKSVEKLVAQQQKSIEMAQRRREKLPTVNYPEQLPVSQLKDEILSAVLAHQVVIVAGETGSGKTTQLPKICLEAGRGVFGKIGHTQPRRLAARTVAHRIAEELAVPMGEQVGYQVRFSDHSNPETLIKLMTDGILLAETQHDRYLQQYDTLIIDEAHERSLNIDFLLGYVKQLLPKRPDLKVIITSATIDVESFSQHFSGAPVVEVSGRAYDVQVEYFPPSDMADGEAKDGDTAAQIVEAVHHICALEAKGQGHRQGDILVFLPGEREIRESALKLRRAEIPHLDVLPLYARLTASEQDQVFNPSKSQGRRIVLATNVAETSLTVPGIRYVIDSGVARISRYSYRTKVQRLPIEAVSQASANQRKGRCGRIAEGTCVRLYDEADFISRPEFTDPEILRTNLAAVILQMQGLGLGDIEQFPFINAPDSRLVRDGEKLLEELGAVSAPGKLSALGRQLLALPVDPRIGRMVLAAAREGCLREMLIIAGSLSVQDPRERPADKRQASDEKHRRFQQQDSDFVSQLKLWDYYEQQREELSQNQLRKMCKREFLSYMRMREWRDIHHQLRLAIKTLKLKENTEPANQQQIHRALLAGLLGHIGFRDEGKEYYGARNRKFHLFPGSAVYKKPPKWVVAAELVETSKLFARTIALIEPEWVLDYAGHLTKKDYSEPHWSTKSGQVMAYEKVSLYGLVLSDRQRVDFGKIDPVVSREIFIRSALVEGLYRQKAAFRRHNLQLLAEIERLEAKTRRRDILVDEQVLYEFFDQRIPENICSLSSFEHWRKECEKQQPELLFLTREYLMRHSASGAGEAQYPNSLQWQDITVPLSYHFEPGSKLDGVTAHVPVALLARLPDHLYEWLVPGMLFDKCVALVKALPKSYRKNFVPVPEYVEKALALLERSDSSLVEALNEALRRITGVKIPIEQWRAETLEDYYRMNFRLLNERGGEIICSRDLAALKHEYQQTAQQTLAKQADNRFEQADITEWNFGELPLEHHFKQAGMKIKAYPALVDDKKSVSVKLLDSQQEAFEQSQAGLLRLLMLALPQQVKYLKKELLKSNKANLSLVGVAQKSVFLDDLIAAVFRRTFLSDITRADAVPRQRQAFESLLEEKRADLVANGYEYEQLVETILTLNQKVMAKLKTLNSLAWAYCASDVKRQLSGLFFSGFVDHVPYPVLLDYPRYLKGVLERLEGLGGAESRDRAAVIKVDAQLKLLDDKINGDFSLLREDHSLFEFRWAIEEYRISLFAQRLGTKHPVSEKRLKKMWVDATTVAVKV
ncbi:ATP-dependent RNA helicase HrpA [Sinobacterium caligoides]|uniref:ATP-dependent RNA helicase HrpA n=1 Tax=Sinobacterium caligoides TaxID=933926 RepID=UPI002482D6BA|nr:ATP-dependent RNA helicase HrpA [Sinobacterium caligoides]